MPPDWNLATELLSLAQGKIVFAHGQCGCCQYRAATHNKGIVNGVDPVVVATGNDSWRFKSPDDDHAAREPRRAKGSKLDADTGSKVNADCQ